MSHKQNDLHAEQQRENVMSTPLPWIIDKMFMNKWQVTAEGKRIITVVEIEDEIDKANAELIIKAVNSYASSQELIEELKEEIVTLKRLFNTSIK